MSNARREKEFAIESLSEVIAKRIIEDKLYTNDVLGAAITKELDRMVKSGEFSKLVMPVMKRLLEDLAATGSGEWYFGDGWDTDIVDVVTNRFKSAANKANQTMLHAFADELSKGVKE